MNKMIAVFAAIGVLAINPALEVTERWSPVPPRRVMKHIEPLTIELKGGTRVGVVKIPAVDDIKVAHRGDATFVTTDPSNLGLGITIPLRSESR
ncbi:MAG: hypothetical protein AB7N91_15150 [Candidatus Tectimicrobiota bacterium]